MMGRNVTELRLLWAVFLMAGTVSAAFNVTQILVAKNTGYGFSDVIQAPDRIFPGDEVSLRFSVFTTRDEGASNAVLTPNTPFLTTTNLISLGNLKKNEAKSQLLTFTVPTGTKPGTYPIYFYVADAVTPQHQAAQYEIVVNEPSVSSRLLAEVVLDEPLRAGIASPVTIAITNTDPIDASDVVVKINADPDKVFTPLGSDRKHVERIPAGQTAEVPFEIGVSAGATPGYYKLPVTLQYAVDQAVQPEISQSLGIQIEAQPELLLTVEGGSSMNVVTLTVANVGDTPVRGVYIKTSSQGFRIVGASDKFIGTLNLDDSTTMAINLQPRGPPSDNSTLDVAVTYKDPNNQEHVLRQSIPLSTNDLLAGGAPGANGNLQAGMRFRGQTRGFLGIDLLGWATIGVVLAVGGFLAYRWYKKRKTASESKPTNAGGKK